MEPAEIFKILGVETRVKILDLLKNRGPLGAKELARTLNITVAAISQHLKILKQAGLLRSERKGYWIPYSINEDALEKCRALLLEVCSCGCRGTGQWKIKDISENNAESLRQYKQVLLEELSTVQCRIEEIDRDQRK